MEGGTGRRLNEQLRCDTWVSLLEEQAFRGEVCLYIRINLELLFLSTLPVWEYGEPEKDLIRQLHAKDIHIFILFYKINVR